MSFESDKTSGKLGRKIAKKLGTKKGSFKSKLPIPCLPPRRGLLKIERVVKEVDHFLLPFQTYWGSEDNHRWSRDGDTKRAARNYCLGLLLPGKRKNMTGIASRLNIDNNVIQQFITDSPWDYESVVATNMKAMGELLTSKDGVIVFDDTGQAKKGTKSPGVARQYSGTLGKVGNCQINVTGVYAIPGDSRNADAIYWPLTMELYLSKEWFEDDERIKAAGIPSDMAFRTKPEIALDHLNVIRDENLRHRAVIADAGYGTDSKFRKQLRTLKEPYALAVTPSNLSVVPEETPLIPPGKGGSPGRPPTGPRFPLNVAPKRTSEIATEIGDEEWKTIEWSEGTKGSLSAQFVRKRVRVSYDGKPTDETGWLLIERTLQGEIKTHICWGLDTFSLEDLGKLIHLRWTVEQCFGQMKREVGMVDFEGRKWRGWHHHVAMVILAFSFLCLLRILESNTSDPLPKIRREFLRLYTQRFLEIRLKISPPEAASILVDLPFLIPE